VWGNKRDATNDKLNENQAAVLGLVKMANGLVKIVKGNFLPLFALKGNFLPPSK